MSVYSDSLITTGEFPYDIALNPDNGYLYVSNEIDQNVSVIDSSTNVVVGTPIEVGFTPGAAAFNPNNGDMYLANLDDNNIVVIDGTTNAVVGTPIPVGRYPYGIAFNPNNGYLYVTNIAANLSPGADDNVSVIDGGTNTVVGTPIAVGDEPTGIAFNPNNGYLYVSNTDNNNVSVIDGSTNTVVGTPITVGNGPDDIAFNPNNGYLYVVNGGGDNVSVIDGGTNTVVGSPIPVGDLPRSIAFNPDNGYLYVTNTNDNTVTVIDGSLNVLVGDPIVVGNSPSDIVYSPNSGDLYVTNADDDTVSVIAPDPPQASADISIDNVSANEGQAGTQDFVFTVTRSRDVSGTSLVDFETLDIDATTANSDYESNSGTLEFAPTETTKTITVIVNGDYVVEPDEKFGVELSNCIDCGITNSPGIGQIDNDDDVFEISSVRPDSGGDSGEVTVELVGEGSLGNADVKLARSGESDIHGNPISITETTIHSWQAGHLVSEAGFKISTMFNLAGKSSGSWNVVVTKDDGNTATVSDGFTIESGDPELSVSIVGSPFIGAVKSRFNFVVENTGNTDAYGVILTIGVPKASSWVLDPRGKNVIAETFPPLGFDGEPADWTESEYFFDSPDNAKQTLIPLLIPLIQAGKTVSIPVSIGSPPDSTGRVFALDAYLTDPMIIVRPQSPPKLSPEMVELLDAYIDLDDHSLDTLELWADMNKNIQKIVDMANNDPNAFPFCEGGNLFQQYKCVIESDPTILKQRCQLFHSLMIGFFGSFLEAADILDIDPIKRTIKVNGVSDLALGKVEDEAIAEAYQSAREKAFGKEITDDADRAVWKCIKDNILKKKASKNVKSLSSVDPNEKAGPNGFEDSPYISSISPFSYTILFENLDSATAPAHQVVVTDQLDIENLDLSTLTLGAVTFGEHLVTPAPGSKEFVLFKDLRPDQNVIVKVEATVDESGLLTWRFDSIDPDTGDPSEDLLGGFLPPNVDSPEGEGSVTFTITPKDLEFGAEIRNSATIVFDNNAPIETNEWLNIIDDGPPTLTGSATSLPNQNGWYNSDVTVHFDGSDSESGVGSVTPDTVITSEMPGQEVLGTAVDNAGNTVTLLISGINIDKTRPTIELMGDASMDVEVGSGPFVDPGAVAKNFPGSNTMPYTVAGTVNTNVLGTYTLTYNAVDQADNEAVAVTRTVNVIPAEQIVTVNPDKDSFLRSGAKNINEGANPLLLLQKGGQKRTVISFDLREHAGEEVESAKLRLYVSYLTDNWGATGRTIDVHKLTKSWVEGNGNNFKPKAADEDAVEPKIRGTGPGVTWMCAVDNNISNLNTNCNPTWNGGKFSSTKTATAKITNGIKGQWVEFDVTGDVNAFLSGQAQNFGWLIKKTNEGQVGRVGFTSSENPDQSHRPELILTFQ